MPKAVDLLHELSTKKEYTQKFGIVVFDHLVFYFERVFCTYASQGAEVYCVAVKILS